jgi:hypothetical protein|tara:strand:+ start:3455 stop:3853 length:399 start_codon:yes stop_codon:yes gene_type:complete
MKMNDIITESAELTPQQAKLASLGRILMNQAVTEKDMELSNTMSKVGNELSHFGALFAARSLAELVQKTGVSSTVIKKLMDHAHEISKHKANIAKDHADGGLDDKDDGDEDEFDSPSDADIDRDADKFAKGQ